MVGQLQCDAHPLCISPSKDIRLAAAAEPGVFLCLARYYQEYGIVWQLKATAAATTWVMAGEPSCS